MVLIDIILESLHIKHVITSGFELVLILFEEMGQMQFPGLTRKLPDSAIVDQSIRVASLFLFFELSLGVDQQGFRF